VRIIYDLFIYLYRVLIGIAALSGNTKARIWIDGRKNWKEDLLQKLEHAGTNRMWIHCASLGEFEQGRPVIEQLKANDPTLFIILTFFSPSGFELRKNYNKADVVCYLPTDTKKNARKFIAIASPKFAVFVKYEFWINYFEELKQKNIPLFVVSSIFRPSQVFFKWYGAFYKKALQNVKHFFVQDENSKKLLILAGIKNVSVTGDTRFDRVLAVSKEVKKFPLVDQFSRNNKVLVAGSSWPEDEEIIFHVLKHSSTLSLKLILAPHEVDENRIHKLEKLVNEKFGAGSVLRYSSGNYSENARVLIIDNIGLLSSLYRYATIAWIGGGFGKGIHNVLEASVFGVPVIFGPEYRKFREATELVNLNGAFSVGNSKDAGEILVKLLTDDSLLTKSSSSAKLYVQANSGATQNFISYLRDSNLAI
jgi:3-deoxy-D-manno-octulosonic-acid transferase